MNKKNTGFSLPEQKGRLIKECERKKYEILEHYEDDHSAKNFNRPEFKRFQADINSGRIKPDIFLCVRYDRFSRTAEQTLKMLSWFKEKNIHFETLEQNYDLSIPENYLPFIVQVALPYCIRIC